MPVDLSFTEVRRQLPLWACVGFAARCARRQANLQRTILTETDKAIVEAAIEKAEEASYRGFGPYSIDTRALSGLAENGSAAAFAARAALHAVAAGGRARFLEHDEKAVRAAISDAAFSALEAASGVAYPGTVASVSQLVYDEFKLLAGSARSEKWTNDSPVPLHYFAVHIDFKVAESSLIEVVGAINGELIAKLREQPVAMQSMNPRAFEELIAHLFDSFGFAVELTSRCRDGGRDVVAVDYKDRRKYLIECKRYKTRKVGVEIVQRLNGVVAGEGATKGIIATTSSFTKPAADFLQLNSVKWRLEGRDFDGLIEWLRLYDSVNMLRS